MIKWLKQMLLLNAVLLPPMVAFPAICWALAMHPDPSTYAAMALLVLGPLSAALYVLLYSQLSTAPWQRGAEAEDTFHTFTTPPSPVRGSLFGAAMLPPAFCWTEAGDGGDSRKDVAIRDTIFVFPKPAVHTLLGTAKLNRRVAIFATVVYYQRKFNETGRAS